MLHFEALAHGINPDNAILAIKQSEQILADLSKAQAVPISPIDLVIESLANHKLESSVK